MSHVRFSKPLWHLVDARDQVVGRMASQIVGILRGKHKPNFCPNYDCGDYVVIINAAEIKFTGQKKTDKLYTWHTGYPGGLKQKSVRDLLQSKPEEVKLYIYFSKVVVIRMFKYELHVYVNFDVLDSSNCVKYWHIIVLFVIAGAEEGNNGYVR